MSTVQDRKAPSAGTKVTTGQNAPVVREGTGAVPSESLAAESHEEGGEFSANRNAEPEVVSGEKLRSATGGQNNERSFAGSNGGEAPSYVADGYIQDESGPHGKNLTEGIDSGRDGLKSALESEPGSENDPSRLAERQFQQGLNAKGGSVGAKREGATGQTTKFDALDREVSS